MSVRSLAPFKSVVGLLCLALPVTAALPGSDSPVADAAQQGDVGQVRQLLRRGADVNAPQGDGMTALHWAAEENDTALARVLLYAGADVAVGTRIGQYTPLHVAAEAGNAEMAAVLLRAGADPNARTTTTGSTPLHLAAASGNPTLVQALLDHGAQVDAREAAWGQTPLMFAAARNRAAAIRVLLAAGADASATARVVNTVEMEKADKAAEKGLEGLLARFKEEEGGGPDWRPSPAQVQAAIEASWTIQRDWGAKGSADGDSAAAKNGDDAAVLTDEGPKGYADWVGHWGGLTPLLHAVRQGNAEAALALLDGGADVDQPSAGDHTSPLLMAAVNGQWDLGMILLERGADPKLASDAGTTPLFAVLERQWQAQSSYPPPMEQRRQKTTYLQIMKALLNAGADPNARLTEHLWYQEFTFSRLGINMRGATPFWRAAHALDVDAMKLLVAYGADPNIATKKPPERKRYSEPDDTVDHSGIPPVPVGGPAVYPIHVASGFGGTSLATALNPWHHVPDGWLPAVRYLVEELGADVNQRDYFGYTPLHWAAARGDNELIKYLVSMGADPTVMARNGRTTVDMANGPSSLGAAPFPETIKLLESLGARKNLPCQYC